MSGTQPPEPLKNTVKITETAMICAQKMRKSVAPDPLTKRTGRCQTPQLGTRPDVRAWIHRCELELGLT